MRLAASDLGGHSLRTIRDDPVALREALIGFDRWGAIRAITEILALVGNFAALVTATRSS